MTFVLEYYLLGSNPNACDAYILQYAYMHRYKNINIHIKKTCKAISNTSIVYEV